MMLRSNMFAVQRSSIRMSIDKLRDEYVHHYPGQARMENRNVTQREALAEQTAAKARVAQAEADIKTAQAKGLRQQAAGHRSEADTSREDPLSTTGSR